VSYVFLPQDRGPAARDLRAAVPGAAGQQQAAKPGTPCPFQTIIRLLVITILVCPICPRKSSIKIRNQIASYLPVCMVAWVFVQVRGGGDARNARNLGKERRNKTMPSGIIARWLRGLTGRQEGGSLPAGGQDSDRRPAGGQVLVLDWHAVQDRLAPVRQKWDLAILAALYWRDGLAPAQIAAVINSHAVPGEHLCQQVLSPRLAVLEAAGWVRHEDMLNRPLRRVYFLCPRGTALVEELSGEPGRAAAGPAAAARAYPVA
jgi:DNA-binding HxlR family transcriptional regulator